MAIQRIDPFDCQMPYPLDLREVKQTVNDRNEIPQNARWVGMQVWVVSESSRYVLTGDMSNTAWVKTYPAEPVDPEIQNLIVNASEPVNSSGADGDMWFKAETAGIKVYQKAAGVWVVKGTLPSGGATKIQEDNSLTMGLTGATLNSMYSTFVGGDMAVNTEAGIQYTKLTNTKWKFEIIEIV